MEEKTMKMAAAQIKPVALDVALNIANHLRMIEDAAVQGVSLVVFPEMSLTGYELEKAASLAFEADDKRLGVFAEKATQHEMMIVVGAPVRIHSKLYIGSFVFSPSGSMEVYTKQYLHSGEERFFTAGFDWNPLIEWNGEKVSFAICADIVNPKHPEAASTLDTTLYVASIFYSTPTGIVEAYEQLGHYAQQYKMQVLMANFTGVSYGLESRGKSAYWNNEGTLMGQLGEGDEGLLVVNCNSSLN